MVESRPANTTFGEELTGFGSGFANASRPIYSAVRVRKVVAAAQCCTLNNTNIQHNTTVTHFELYSRDDECVLYELRGGVLESSHEGVDECALRESAARLLQLWCLQLAQQRACGGFGKY